MAKNISDKVSDLWTNPFIEELRCYKQLEEENIEEKIRACQDE